MPKKKRNNKNKKSDSPEPSGEDTSSRRKAEAPKKVIHFRRRNHDDWAVAATTSHKQDFLQKVSPEAWGDDLALHHIISKTTLEGIGEMLLIHMQDRKSPALQKSAKAFWAAVQEATSDDVKQQTQDPIKTLWNMAVNLEIGPAKVIDNPGIGFDPNTVADPHSAMPGARKLDPVSTPLKKIETVFWENQDAGLTAEHWNKMTAALKDANSRYKQLHKDRWSTLSADDQRKYQDYNELLTVVPPSTEQWVAGAHNNFQRKGLRHFLGQQVGLEKFEQDRVEAEDISALEGSEADAVEPETISITIGNQTFDLKVVLTEDALHHLCTRHTYKHFDFGEAKAINTFWPEGTTVADLKGKLPLALAHVAKIAAEQIGTLLYDENNEVDPSQWASLADLHAANQVVGNDTMFFIVGLEPDFVDDDTEEDGGHWQWKATIKTMAADGETGEAYSATELEAIQTSLD